MRILAASIFKHKLEKSVENLSALGQSANME